MMTEVLEADKINDEAIESNVVDNKNEDQNTNNSVQLKAGDEVNKKLPPVPDGGWGWVIVVAAFLVSACADGLAVSFGILHEEFTRVFETSQFETSLIGSIFIATPLLVGPLSSALVDRYGCRAMTIVASLLSTLGFLLAAVSNSVVTVYLTFGIISGLAMGILYVTAVVSVAFWFEKRRNLVISLASCGIGFGTLIYSPITNYLLEVYDWRNTIVLLAGTLLNISVCGVLMRDPEWLIIQQKNERYYSKSVAKDSIQLSEEELIKTLLKSGQSPEYILTTLVSSIAESKKLNTTTQLNTDEANKRNSAIHVPNLNPENEKVPPEVIEKLKDDKQLYKYIKQNFPFLIAGIHLDDNSYNENKQAGGFIELARLSIESNAEISKNNPKTEIKCIEENNEFKKAGISTLIPNPNLSLSSNANENNSKPVKWFQHISMKQNYLRDLSLHRKTIMRRGAMLTIPKYKLKASSLPEIYRNSMPSVTSESDNEMKWCYRCIHVLKKTFDLGMYSDFHFLLFSVSTIIISASYIVPYFFLKSYMTEMNTEASTAIIAIIGITNSIGIVGVGWAGDQPWINLTKTYAFCLIICGVSVATFPHCMSTYWALGAVSAAFGLSIASIHSYTPTILIDMVPVDRFTAAYGMILLSQGIGHLIGPPLGGLLYDLTKSWEMTFYMSGLWLVISGVCIGVIAYTKDRRLSGIASPVKETEEDESKITVEVDPVQKPTTP